MIDKALSNCRLLIIQEVTMKRRENGELEEFDYDM